MNFKRVLLSFLAIFLCSLGTLKGQDHPIDGSVLPFPPTPLSESVTRPQLQDSTMKWPQQPQRLPNDAPNILIVLVDDVGFGISETFDIGVDLGSTVSLDYYDKRPFAFEGKIEGVKIGLK